MATDSAGGDSTAYDGFISYSHAADDLLAPRLQSALQRFAKPWWKRRAVRIFRDESSLSANPHLWSSITEALDTSGWFVLLLSPDAAQSEWVNQEISYWVENRDPKTILPVVTDGNFGWADGEVIGDAVPDALRGVFSEEPRWVDVRWAREEEQLDLQNPRFADAVADVASAIRGVPKDDLASEEVRQHRRTVRTAWAAGGALLALTVVAAAASVFAIGQRNEAREAQFESETRRLASDALAVASDNPQLALLLAAEAYQRDQGPVGLGALQQALIAAGSFGGTYGAGRSYFDAAWMAEDHLAAVWEDGLDLIDITSGTRETIELDVRLSETEQQGFRSAGSVAIEADAGRIAIVIDNGVAVVELDGTVDLIEVEQPVSIAIAGDRLAIGTDSGAIELHHLESPDPPLVIEGHPETWETWTLPEGLVFCCGLTRETAQFNGVTSLAFDRERSRLASAAGPIVREWDPDTGALLGEFVNAISSLETLEFPEIVVVDAALGVTSLHYVEGDLSQLIVNSGAGGSRWDTSTSTRLGTFFHPSGRTDVGPLAQPLEVSIQTGTVGAMVFPNGRLAAYPMDGYPDGATEEVWQGLLDGSSTFGSMFEDQASIIETGITSPRGIAVRGDRVAVATTDGVAVISLGGSGLLARAFDAPGFDVASISPLGDLVALSRQPGDDVLLDLTTGETRPIRFEERVLLGGVFVPDPDAPTMKIFAGDLSPVVNARTLEREGLLSNFVDQLTFNPRNDLVAGMTLVEVSVYDRARGLRVAGFPRADQVQSVDFDASGTRLAISGTDGTSIIDTETWTVVDSLGGPGQAVVSAFGPAGLFLAVGDADGSMTLHDADSLRPLRELAGFVGRWSIQNYGIHFSADESLVLTTYEGISRLWDTSTGLPIGDPFPSDPGITVSGAEGDRLLLATILDDQALVWDLDVDSWLDRACLGAGRNMNAEEWALFGPTDQNYRETCAAASGG